ncbi:hypothetical protein D3C84_1149830 [compost metagenome]
MPLFKPRDQLIQGHQHGRQLPGIPAVALLALHIPAGNRLGTLQVVHAGPANHQGRVAGLFAAR